MEIVHVIRQYKPSVGGLEDATHNLCTHLNRIPGCTARVVTLNRLFTHPNVQLPHEEVVDGIHVTRISYSGSSRYPFAPDILKHIKSADIVHVHAIDFFFDFLSLFRFLHHKPLVASTHGGFFHTSFAAKLKKIYFQTITRFNCMGYKTICASSENDAATFSAISSKNLVTIENGVNVEKWHDAGSKVATRTMIFIGRWSANKRVTTLIKLAVELQKLNPEWQVIIAGLPADDTAHELMHFIKSRDVSDAVRIVTAPSEADIKSLIGQASYIASASAYEGFGISIIEGLSAGLYPIVSPLPPFKKLLVQLGFGAQIDPNNLAASAVNIEAAHAKLQADTKTMRERCMRLSQNYAWAGVAQKFMDVYKAIR